MSFIFTIALKLLGINDLFKTKRGNRDRKIADEINFDDLGNSAKRKNKFNYDD